MRCFNRPSHNACYLVSAHHCDAISKVQVSQSPRFPADHILWDACQFRHYEIHHDQFHHHHCHLVKDRHAAPCPLATSVDHNVDKGIRASSQT